jgi:hypothetical protein
MKFLPWWMGFVLALASCQYDEVEREVGYKGKARINPWLAAERYAVLQGADVKSAASWTEPVSGDDVWFIPASVLNNRSYVRTVQQWVHGGGHLILLLEHTAAETSDWSRMVGETRVEPALSGMLSRMDLHLLRGNKLAGERVGETQVEFGNRKFRVDASSRVKVRCEGGTAGALASAAWGAGRVTVVTDARIFRNRWVDTREHAELLDALIGARGFQGVVGFMRGSNLSFLGLLREDFLPVLAVLALLVLLWLWKSATRFGPVDAGEESTILRGYENHLEAMGGFQWRLDGAAGWIAAVRAKVLEGRHRLGARAMGSDEDFYLVLSERSELPIRRVMDAMSATCADEPSKMVLLTKDLQQLLSALPQSHLS